MPDHNLRLLGITASFAALLLSWLAAGSPLRAEGSLELTNFEVAQGGDVRYPLNGGMVASPTALTWTVFGVYLESGDTVHLGSNAIHTGGGNIYLWDPSAAVLSGTYPSPAIFASALVDCVAQAAGDTDVGLIDTRAKEVAGPEVTPGDGGYVSCQLTAATAGLYQVMFRAALDTGANPSNQAISNPAIPAQNNTGVHAWDATVRDAGGADQPGRLFASSMAFYETGGGGPDQQLYVLTRDGHRYRVTTDELDGIGWFLYANNKGVQVTATGEPTYRSWIAADIDDPGDSQFVHVPFDPDTAADVTYKMFVNPPDPVAVTGANGLADTLGYRSAPGFLPAPTSLVFDGSASGGGIAMAPNGFNASTFTFDSDPGLDGIRFVLVIDADRNGSFDDAVDRRLNGVFDSAGNNLPYDGTDGAGDPLTFDNIYAARIQGIGAEVHFPFQDVESLGGMTIERLTNVAGGGVFRAAYDDFNTVALTTASPTSLPQGGDSSAAGFHGWGGSSGNNDLVDTWAFAAVTGPASTHFAVGSPAAGVPPAFSKAFSPNPVPALEVSTLTFTIDNLANPVPAVGLDFSDTFPAGMVVATRSNGVTTCTGGTLTATPGAGSMSYTGGSVAANSRCAIALDVTSSVQGLAANVSGELSSDLGSSGTATDTLEVLEPLPVADLSVVKEASAGTVSPGEPLFYTVTATNNSPSVAVPDVVVTDLLPPDVTLVATSGCAEDPSGVPICTLGAVAPQASVSYGIEVLPDAAAGATVTNLVEVSSASTNDDNAANDVSVVDTLVGTVLDIPTLASGGLALMALLIMAGAWWALRRR